VRFIGLILTVSVLMTHVVNISYVYHNKHSKSNKSENKKSESKEQAQIQEYHNDVLVPSHVFDFGSDVILNFSQSVEFFEITDLFTVFSSPIYKWSYFEKLFELHIAINAP
jgi:hypothetical protein